MPVPEEDNSPDPFEVMQSLYALLEKESGELPVVSGFEETESAAQAPSETGKATETPLPETAAAPLNELPGNQPALEIQPLQESPLALHPVESEEVPQTASHPESNQEAEISSMIEDILTQVENTLPAESAEEEPVFPWEEPVAQKTTDIPTQPVRVSRAAPPPIPIAADIPTSPIKVGAAIEFIKSEMEDIRQDQKEAVHQHAAPTLVPEPVPFVKLPTGDDFLNLDSADSILMKYNEDIVPYGSSSKPAREAQPGFAAEAHRPATQLFNNITFTCMLVPRLPEDMVNDDLAHFLANLLPQICLVFGWQLGKVEFKPDYMLWTAQVLPAVSPGHMVRVIRQRTSKHIFQQYPDLKSHNPSDDFWAPGYLIINGNEPPTEKAMQEFIQQTRRRQRLLKSISR